MTYTEITAATPPAEGFRIHLNNGTHLWLRVGQRTLEGFILDVRRGLVTVQDSTTGVVQDFAVDAITECVEI